MRNDDVERVVTASAVAHIALTEDEKAAMTVTEDGMLDLPLSVVRKLADWLQRYDARRQGPRPTYVDRTPRW